MRCGRNSPLGRVEVFNEIFNKRFLNKKTFENIKNVKNVTGMKT